MSEKLQSIDELKNILEPVESPIERKLYFLGWLNRQLAALNVNDFPVLVGGSAVALYTAGNYSTLDIDLCYSSPRLDSILLPVGFYKEGRYWVHEELDILLECPSSNYSNRIFAFELNNGDHVYVSSIEDMIIDRLCAFAFWNSPSDGEWAQIMLSSQTKEGAIDWQYLEKRAKEENIAEYLAQIKTGIIPSLGTSKEKSASKTIGS